MCCFRVSIYSSHGLSLCGECCPHEWLCGTGAIRVMPTYSSFCFNCRKNIVNIKRPRQCLDFGDQTILHLSILFVPAINKKIFKDVRISASLGYFHYFYCVLHISTEVSCVWYMLCVGRYVFVIFYCTYIFFVVLF